MMRTLWPIRFGVAPQFAPFRASRLGLGLFIVAEIAKSHGGSVGVTSGEGLVTLTFSMG